MGGGGGSSSSGSSSSGVSYPKSGRSVEALKNNVKDNIEKTEKKLKDTKRVEPISRNVFISFHMEDEAQVKFLRHQAKDERFDFKFRDYSIKEPFSNAWKTQTLERIRQSSATIVMIGTETHTREAVLWEINKSYELGKEVIGLRIYRNDNHQIPQPMLDNNAPILDWNLGDLSEVLTQGLNKELGV